MLKFIVMSDLHLVSESELSHSIDTNERLVGAIKYINSMHSDAAFCILNGDLVDLGDTGAYSQLKIALQKLEIPVYFTLGNHDNAEAFEQVFGADKTVFDHAIVADDHHILVLNSQDDGKVTGRLDEGQLAWLKAELNRARGKPVMLILVTTIAGNHYSFAPFSDPDISDMTRVDGPGEIGVVLSDAETTMVHFDKFLDKNSPMPSELFVWNG